MTWKGRNCFKAALLTLLASSFATIDPVAAQGRGARLGTRADLEAEMERLQQQAVSAQDDDIRERIRMEIQAISQRLREGDITQGDVIALAVAGEAAWTDNFVVTVSRTIELETLPPISVANVLYSELEDHMTAELGRYLREPRVRAEALKRIAVLGAVGTPGFMSAPGSTVVADLIMLAGGPMTTADVDDAEFRRRGESLGFDDGPIAFQAYTLDELGIRSGDELHIPTTQVGSFWEEFRFVALGIGAVALTLTRIF